MSDFAKRRVGKTDLEVTVLGLGCATLGGTRIAVSPAEAEAIVRAAWDSGVRYVDTAPYYGFGQAERAVGDALRGPGMSAATAGCASGNCSAAAASGTAWRSHTARNCSTRVTTSGGAAW